MQGRKASLTLEKVIGLIIVIAVVIALILMLRNIAALRDVFYQFFQ